MILQKNIVHLLLIIILILLTLFFNNRNIKNNKIKECLLLAIILAIIIFYNNFINNRKENFIISETYSEPLKEIVLNPSSYHNINLYPNININQLHDNTPSVDLKSNLRTLKLDFKKNDSKADNTDDTDDTDDTDKSAWNVVGDYLSNIFSFNFGDANGLSNGDDDSKDDSNTYDFHIRTIEPPDGTGNAQYDNEEINDEEDTITPEEDTSTPEEDTSTKQEEPIRLFSLRN